MQISRNTCLFAVLCFGLALALPLHPHAAARQTGPDRTVSPDLYSGLEWRSVGPFHGGRISAVTGVIGQPGVYYFGTPLGGMWKTTSAGARWFPIGDALPGVDSIGAIQVTPSDPNIVYAGSGDPIAGGDGDGMYKSTDAGKTWAHIGLQQTHRLSKMAVDPKDPNLVVVGAVGDDNTDGAGGVYRTTDGGQTWDKVLTPSGVTAVRDLEYAFDMPNVMFAATMGTGGRGFGAGGRGGAQAQSTPAKLFKSTDEGKTWTEITSLPKYPGRISVAVAMHTNGQRVYVVGNDIENGSGLFRSDDGGATWKHMANGDTRIANGQGAYSSGVWVDSQNPDVLYTVATALYRSTDGGNTFTPFKGAPGGEDYHVMWIDPTNGRRIFIGADQGASVSLDGGGTWSLWYLEPLAQVYHVSTDSRYPYWIMAAQQDTGAVMIRSRGDFGQINFTDWLPLPSSEFGTITADPLHPGIVYGVGYGAGGGGGSNLVKINVNTGQWENVAPNFGADGPKYRASRDFGKKFDTAFDPHAMYVAYQCLLVTRDGAQTWKPISPDLTTKAGEPVVPCGTPEPPAAARSTAAAARTPAAAPARGRGARGGAGRGARRGATPTPAPAPAFRRGGGPAIADFVLSTAQKGAIWTVSTTGQIYRTVDGGLHWANVSHVADAPANIAFNTIDGGHHDTETAYVSGRIPARRGGAPENEKVDSNVPLIWRTHDGGKTWTKIVDGLPSDERTGSWVNVVREDPKQKGLLFCGTETTVYVSFDDGDHWQSLRQNLPSTSIRDLVFHTDDHMNDIVIGTYGRGFWVLDDMSPLREVAAKAQEIAAAPVYFFKPGDAIRARINANWDQPISVEMPHAPNPPYGAILYYHLSQPPAGQMTLQVFDAAGTLVRTMSSIPPPPIEDAAYPDYWLATPASRALSTKVGTNRFNWDLHYDDPPSFGHDLENQMNMVEGSVTPGPHGPQVPPGVYTLKLTVDGKVYTQTVTVHNDPRVGESPAILAALKSQNALTQLAYRGMKDTYAANDEVAAARAQVSALQKGQVPADLASRLKDLDTKLATFGGAVEPRGARGFGGFGRGGPAPGAMQSFIQLNGSFSTMVSMVQVGLDMAPTRAEVDTWESDCKNYGRTLAAWKQMQGDDLKTFNDLLTKDKLTPLSVTPTSLTAPSCTFAPAAAPASAPHRQ
ncbi:MAG TPA: hypothetical protein VFX12_16030 [Vicinamibacterales bacterium]|nr:hypothetical protein [Vicinamibacterales bacterium]